MLRYLTETANDSGWYLNAIIWASSFFGVTDPTIVRIVAGVLLAAFFFYAARFVVLATMMIINIILDTVK